MLKKHKGFSLVEILIVVGIIGLILVILVISLNAKQAQLRDLQRVKDVRTLQEALQVMKNETGSYERSYCSPGIVSRCSSNNSFDLLKLLPNLKNINDPTESAVGCEKDDTCRNQSCNYTFTKVQDNDYEIRFHLEKGIENFPSAGCYIATPQGTRKL